MRSLILALTLALMLTGCATWQSAGGRSLATVAQTVDSAMKGWETYSVRTSIPDNDPQELRVKVAYLRYQIAFQTALDAYNAAVKTKDKTVWEQASASLTASQGSLLQLITTLEAK